ncbi:hypothetical protein [Elizabethkingia anophelis]|uniref:hypothetical protein n=1 Tax=Elizabethkingia anophelis TaxID=1117645 RepID=UPI00389273CC
MKKKILFLLFAILMINSCSRDDSNGKTNFKMQSTTADYTGFPAAVETINGTITADTTWTSDKVWELDGQVDVAPGVTLTIQPGTFVKGKQGTISVLVILRGAKINAVGTEQNPIVFTSYNLLDNDASTTAFPGDFGGIILLGNAPANVKKTIEGISSLEDKYKYGADYGANPGDNSGILKYIRIEYAGYNLSQDNEINGLTCAGVGSGTTLEHIQVSYSKDDAFEFFGGTVNASNLIAFAPIDDGLDFDNGYTGKITNAVIILNKYSVHSNSSGIPDSNGIELDNNSQVEDGSFGLLPKTHPILSNVSVYGVNNSSDAELFKYGARIRRGGEITLNNIVITGFTHGIVFDEDTNVAWSSVNNSGFSGFTAAVIPTGSVNNTNPIFNGSANTFGATNPFFDILDFDGSTKGAFITKNWITEDWIRFEF